MTEAADHAAVRVHPPLVLLFFLALAFLLSWLIPFPKMIPTLLSEIGILLVCAGLVLAFLAVSRFRRAGTSLDPHGSVQTLVTSGPYKLSRNPIYLGFVCAIVGLPLTLGTYWGVVLSPLE